MLNVQHNADVREKAARARCGASVRKGHNQPPRPDGTRHGATAGAVRCAGTARGCRYSTQTPPPAADVAKCHHWSDSPNPTSKQFERLMKHGANP